MASSSYFSEGKKTLALAFPIVIGQVGQMAMGIIDSAMIGRVGTVPLAASSLAQNVFGFFYLFGIGLLQPLSVLVARARGKGQVADAEEVLTTGISLSLMVGVGEAAVMLLLGTQMGHLGQPPEVVVVALPFFQVIAVSMVPTMLFQVCRQYSEACGKPWQPMMILLSAIFLNIGLNRLWIYGAWGFSAHGLVGAGWATLVSRVVALLGVVFWLRRVQGVRLFPTWQRSHVAELIRLGIPAGSQLLFEGGAFSAAGVMMGWLGAQALAAHQIALSCVATTFMFVMGIASAVSVRVGEASGTGDTRRLRVIGTSGLLICLSLMAFFGLLLWWLGGALAGSFVNDAPVVALATRLLLIAAVFQIFDGGQVVGSAMLRGISDVRVPTVITFAAYWLLAMPGGYLLGFHSPLGAEGIWVALAGGLAVAAIFFALRFRRLTHPAAVSLRRG